MIINATLGNGFSGALQYIHKTNKKLKENERSEVIERNNLIGSNPKLLAFQMREQANRSGYSKKPVLHLSFNFANEDNLTRQKEVECVKASMKHLGISEENHQFVIVKHNDSKHSHYHAIINKVSDTNKILDTNWIRNKCVVTADKIEQDFKLSRTANRTIVFAENEKGYQYASKEERLTNAKRRQTKVFKDKEINLCEYKIIIRDGIREVLEDTSIQTAEQFKIKLDTKGVSARFAFDAITNKIKGTAFKFQNRLVVKGSEVGFSANIILEKLEQNKQLSKEMLEQIEANKIAEIRKEENRLKAIEESKIAHLTAEKTAWDNILNEHISEFRKGNITPDTKSIFIKNGFSHKESNTYEFRNNNRTSTISSQFYEDYKIKLQIKKNQDAKAEVERAIQLQKEQENQRLANNKQAHLQARTSALEKIEIEHNIEFLKGNYTPNTRNIFVKHGFIQDVKPNNYIFEHSNLKSESSSQKIEDQKINLQIKINALLTQQSAKKDSPPIETKPQQTQPIQPKREPIKPQPKINKSRGFRM